METNRRTTTRWASILALAFFVLLPSTRLLKQVGWPFILAYLTVGLITLAWYYRVFLPKRVAVTSERKALWFALLGLGALLLLAIPAHRAINAGQISLPYFSYGNSDIDDAIVEPAKALCRGEYPYDVELASGNPISPLPGSLILAVPFHLLGSIVIQHVFWLLILFGIIAFYLKSYARSFWLLLPFFVASPKSVESIFQGVDYIPNGLFVFAGVVWLVEAARKERLMSSLAAALFLGLTLSSRINFMLLMPLVFASLYRLRGLRQALLLMATVGGAFCLVTLPFYFYDPAGFDPIRTLRYLNHGNAVATLLGRLSPFAALLLACVLAWRRKNDDPHVLAQNCFAVQALVVLVAIAANLATGNMETFWNTTAYVFLFLPFGFLGFGRAIAGNDPRPERP